MTVADPFLRLAANLDADAAAPHRQWRPLDHQVPPEEFAVDGPARLWLLLAGRGAGKTDACAAWVEDHVAGPPCYSGPGGHRLAIIAPTLGDALEACVLGPSGLKAHNPAVTHRQSTGGTYVRWPSGAEAKLFGAHTADDVERLRAGGNRCAAWVEELAAWRYLEEAWDHMTFGLRLGARPRVVGSTTPKNRPKLRELIADPTTAITTATTDDNPHLDATVRAKLFDRYGGTRLGRQELYAELLEDVEGALWTAAMIDEARIADAEAVPTLVRVVVAVDPSWGTKGDECGIVVAGRGADGRAYVLDDCSLRATPAEWGAVVAAAYERHSADRILAEVNFGAEMVRLVMRTVDPTLTFAEMRATRGKAVRAEPVVGLYEQGKVSHVGTLAGLEDQMLTWVPAETDWSPDRVDALVWALTDLMLTRVPSTMTVSNPARRRVGDGVGAPGAPSSHRNRISRL